MNRKRPVLNRIAAIFIALLLWAAPVLSQNLRLKGQLSGWFVLNNDRPSTPRFGIRYIPTFSLAKTLTKGNSLDVEFSLNSYGIANVPGWKEFQTEGKVKPYRLWVRFSSSQFEARLGLQQINFGSASLLRPLMWFDRVDARDPLQITDGVYGLVLRYFFVNNANIWVWGLYGNDEPKGWEIHPTDDKSLEYGGRFQVPLFSGEIAFTFHHRQTDLSKGLFTQMLTNDRLVPENRYALDGKWDIGVGLWVEGYVIHQDSPDLPFPYRRTIDIGLDYTFGLGNGLNVLGEHFVLKSSTKAFGPGETMNFSALSLLYPLGLLDNVSSIVYYDWKTKNFYRFVNWKRTYDKWSFYLIGFWNPRQFQIYPSQAENNLFAGKGFQIMVVFNH